MVYSARIIKKKNIKNIKGDKYVIKGFISFKIVIENQHFYIFL